MVEDDAELGDRAVQGRVVGVIRPPPDIRAVLEKTATFIAKNGAEFEARILEQQAGVAKFGFLRADNPYHAYYKQRIATEREEIEKAAKAKALGLPSEAAAAPAEAPPAAAAAAAASAPAPAGAEVRKVAAVPNPVSKALRMLQHAKEVAEAGRGDGAAAAAAAPPGAGEASVLPQPAPPSPAYLAALLAPKDLYSVPIPTFASATDLETVRTTAQFVAAGGRAFLNALTDREEANPAFGFLRRTHALFPFFTALVEAYARVVHPPALFKEAAARDADPHHGRASVLQRCVARLEAQRKAEEAKAAAGGGLGAAAAAAPIDWHDFVVVETISLDFAALDLEADAAASGEGASAGQRGGFGAADSSADAAESFRVVRGGTEGVGASAGAMPASLVQSVSAATLAAAGASAVFVDPSTGRLIKAEEAALHIRAETMDPQWKKDRDVFLSRQAVTTFVAGDEVAANLKRMASKRGDVFAGRDAGAPEAKRPRTE